MNIPAPHLSDLQRCLHCDLPLALEQLAGDDGRFCCAGCAMAHELISGLGLGRYYAARELDASARALKPDDSQAGLDFSRQARVIGDDAAKSEIALVIEGYQCAACGWLIEQVLARDRRVTWARVNMSTRRLKLIWQGPVALADDILSPILKLGYRLFPYDGDVVEQQRAAHDRDLLKAMAVAGFAAANVMLLSVAVWAGYSEAGGGDVGVGGMGPATRDLLHWISALIALPAVVYAGRPFFRAGLRALIAGRVNMDVPISLAVILTSGMSLFQTITGAEHVYFDSAVGLLFFLLIGRYLESRVRSRARSSAAQLLALTAKTVTVIEEDGSRREIACDAVDIGMTVTVAAGERIGIDGIVMSGRSEIDQSLLSGESLPVSVGPGNRVSAGTLNIAQPLEIDVTAVGEATALAEIVKLMEQAEQGRARYVNLAERVARLYAPVVHSLGAATFVGWLIAGAGWQVALLNAVAVLIITCPCALALAVPAVQVVAASRLMRRGILLKSPTALERLAEVDTIVFDKTGTLTEGRPRPDNALPDDALSLAAGLAARSKHPLARAVVRAAMERDLPLSRVDPVQEIPGKGLLAMRGDTEVRLGSRSHCDVRGGGQADGPELWLRVGNRAPVQFRFEDKLRPDALPVVAALQSRGYDVRMLSGDLPETVDRVARQLGIDHFQGAVDPAEKHRVLQDLARAGHRVLMVGDGLNDAPALAAAFVSLSPSSAADISQTASDAVFQGGLLEPVPETLLTAQRAGAVVRQNLVFAFAYNATTIPFAIAGLVTPLFAAVAMSASSIIVIINALRLGSDALRPGPTRRSSPWKT
jgi:Cu2+-exporting ATPase